MPKRIDSLTEAQKAQMDAWADRWISIGLRTGDADRAKFEAAAKRCYEHAGIPWHGNVVWTTSPLAMAFAAPAAAYLIALIRKLSEGDAVDVAVLETIKQAWSYVFGGQFWAGGWGWGGAYTSFFREVCGLELKGDLWERGKAYEATIESACWWYPHKDFLMVSERPRHIDRELADPARPRGWGSHRLHSNFRAAVEWPDGWGPYVIHGVRVTRQIVVAPETLTIAQIEGETNAEVRRIMIDRFGPKRYLEESGAQVVEELPETHYIVGFRTARLLRKEVPGDETIYMIDVLNSTPEPDGTIKRYQLRVDGSQYGGQASRDCLAAIASTWRLPDGSLAFKRPQNYAPVFES